MKILMYCLLALNVGVWLMYGIDKWKANREDGGFRKSSSACGVCRRFGWSFSRNDDVQA